MRGLVQLQGALGVKGHALAFFDLEVQWWDHSGGRLI